MRLCEYTSVTIKKSTNKEKKLMAIFTRKNNKTKTVHFGARGYSDYTIHKDAERKERYISRHKARENWNKCDTAGSLSRYILWQYPSLQASIKYFKNKFNLK